jgi:hypothetical protein
VQTEAFQLSLVLQNGQCVVRQNSGANLPFCVSGRVTGTTSDGGVISAPIILLGDGAFEVQSPDGLIECTPGAPATPIPPGFGVDAG